MREWIMDKLAQRVLLTRVGIEALCKMATAGLLAVGVLSGCTLGPRYVKPEPTVAPAFGQANSDTFEPAHAPASALWHSFGDPVLDSLIDTALAHNKSLAQAIAQVNEARALRGLEAFALLPTVTASGGRNTSRPSGRDPFVPRGIGKTTTYKAGFDAAWEIDLFGGARSARQAVRADQAAAEAGLDVARQAVVAEVAQAYFSLRAEQERLRVQTRSIANLEENQHLLEARLGVGRGTALDTSRARALWLQTASRLPQTEVAITRDEQRLAVLTVQSAESLRAQVGEARPLPPMPPLVTVGTPAEWLRRRPDVRQAERRLAATTARVGIDAADYLPNLTMIGAFGWTAQVAKALGSSAAQRWNYGPSLQWSFLDVGRVRQRVLAGKARAGGALAAYDQTVLLALEETENALGGYRAGNRSALILAEAVASARTATEVAKARFDAGAVDTLTLLDAERSQLDLEDQLATAESQRATALAALYKALAGDFAARP